MTKKEVLQELSELRDRLLGTIGNDYARDVENIMAMVESEDEPGAKYRVHVQRNVVGVAGIMDYPKNVELIPYGPEFDTEDAAKLWGSKHGWMDIWWNVQQSNR